MSINLAFKTKKNQLVDFPFQTPTSLTYAVLKASTIDERLSLIDNELKSRKFSLAERRPILLRVQKLLSDTNLTLVSG